MSASWQNLLLTYVVRASLTEWIPE